MRIDRGKSGGKKVPLWGKARFAMPASGLAPARAYLSLLTWTADGLSRKSRGPASA